MGPAPHDIDDDAGDLGDAGKAQVFLHEGKPRAAGGGHGLDSGQGSADDRAHGGDFVLHLDEGAPQSREAPAHGLADLGGRRDGVARKEAAARGQGSLHHGFIALEQHRATGFIIGNHFLK